MGPILAAIKVRKVFRMIENAQSKGELMHALRGQETEDVSIDLIAVENRIPRFLAKRVYKMIANKPSMIEGSQSNSMKSERADGLNL